MQATEAASGIKPRDFVNSLARGLEVLRAFDDAHSTMTLSDVAAKTGLTRAGARRFLLTLVELGYVAKQDRLFRLTPKVLGLGYAYLSSMPLSDTAQPYLEEITARVEESSSLAVLDGEDVVYIARSPAKRLLMVGIHVGTRFPAHITSMGRVLLADLPAEELESHLSRIRLYQRTPRSITSMHALRAEIEAVRRQGYAILDQELEQGVRSIAVPVIARKCQRAIAAINISTNVATVPKERLIKEFLPVLQEAAARLEDTLPEQSPPKP